MVHNGWPEIRRPILPIVTQVLQALRRPKGSSNRKEKMSPETKVVFDQLTEDAMKLMEDDVYDEKQEVFQRGSSGHCGARMFQTTSHLKIASNLKKQSGRDPSRSELFLYTHTKNHDGTSFIVEKAKKIHDDFMERRDELEAIGEEIDEDQLFYDVVGGHDRKRRLYGFDLYGKVIPSSKGCSETCYSSDNNVEKESVETKAEIEKLKELVETQREQSDAKCGKLEQQLAQAMSVINALTDQVKTFTSK